MRLTPIRFFILSAFLSCHSFIWADTQVDAVLIGPQTWTETGSPYRISRDTIVSSSSVLTIEPGVVVLVSTHQDKSIPNLTPRVDWVVQGRLIIHGTEAKPVKIISVDKNSPWGALFIASPQNMDWRFADIQGGRLVVTNAQLTLEDSRVSSGEGIQVGAQAKVNLIRCQIDANLLGIGFLDSSARVNLVQTRLWDNETALYFKTNGSLTASESSVSNSDKWNVVNATTNQVRVPILWWGNTETTEITKKVYDGSRRKGIGMVSFDGVASSDPFVASVSGFIPNSDPRKRLWKGPKYFVGLDFQWVIPKLNIPFNDGKAKFNSTLGYGAYVGWLADSKFEMRALFQTSSFTSSSSALNSHYNISFVQVGIAGRYLLPVNAQNSLFGFVEGGGLLGFDKQSNSYPKDLTKPLTSEIVKNNYPTGTNLGLEGGLGIMTRLGSSYKAEIGLHYNRVPLGNNQGDGGSLLSFQAGLAFYF
jgi:hypothetical protein